MNNKISIEPIKPDLINYCNFKCYKGNILIKPGNLPLPVVTSDMSTNENMCIDKTHNLWNFGGDTILHRLMIVNYEWKYQKTQ